MAFVKISSIYENNNMTYEPLNPAKSSNNVSDDADQVEKKYNSANLDDKKEGDILINNSATPDKLSPQKTNMSSHRTEVENVQGKNPPRKATGFTPPPPIQSKDESNRKVLETTKERQKEDKVKNLASPVFPPNSSGQDQSAKIEALEGQNYKEIKEGVETSVKQNKATQNINNVDEQQKSNQNNQTKINNINSAEDSLDQQNTNQGSNLKKDVVSNQ